jgi:pyruvate/2-oxoglutarate dehydrogenase complex dihydrolipoamide acyltransferase (E2) component
MIEVRVPEGLWDAGLEGVITTWLFDSGDEVTQGVPVAELMAEKATFSLEAPASGTLTILAKAETPVLAGQVIALITPLGSSDRS